MSSPGIRLDIDLYLGQSRVNEWCKSWQIALTRQQEVILAAAILPALTNGGTAGLFWGWIIVVTGFMLVYSSLSELASMAPNSGGQYSWVSEFAPDPCERFLSYLTGWLSFTG